MIPPRAVISFILSCILFLVSMEMSLRALGFVSASQLQYRCSSSWWDSKLTIATLGESTTSDVIYWPKSWPSLLYDSLKEAKLKFCLINLATPATTTTDLVEKFYFAPSGLHPDIVISMMGINDNPHFWLNEERLVSSDDFFHRLRIVKLANFIIGFRGIVERQKEDSFALDVESALDYPNSQELITKISRARSLRETVDIDVEIEHFLRNKTATQKSQFYHYIQNRVRVPWGSKNPKFIVWFHYLKKALEGPLTKENSNALGDFLAAAKGLGKIDDCRWAADSLLAQRSQVSSVVIGRLVACIPNDTGRLKELLHGRNEFEELRPGSRKTPTEENYRLLYRKIRHNGAFLIAMQYPLRPIEELKSFFRGVDRDQRAFPGLFLVSNEENFREALRTHSYDEVFFDRFAGDFGHATVLGNRLIARSAYDAVMNLVRERKLSEIQRTP